MATRRGIAPTHAHARERGKRGDGERRVPTAAETAWLLLLPTVAISVAIVALLGPPLGRLAFSGADYTYWPSAAAEQLRPKPTELARFALTVLCALAFAALLPFAASRAPRLRRDRTRSAVLVAQGVSVAALAFFWVAQRSVEPYSIGDPTYFAPLAIVVALALAALIASALARPALVARLRAAASDPRWSTACGIAAVVLTVLWLLPSIFTDANVAYTDPELVGHLQFTFDEAISVLNGRSPLVDMTIYGSLVPYLVALPLAAFDGSLAAFTTLMTLLNVLALLAVYGVLRRLTRNALAALALYLPVLATSLFIVRGESDARYDFGNYFGMFPLRYFGPYVLAWLTVRHLDGARPRSTVPLFACAGLVVLNNTDFGLPALGATLVAVVCAQPPRSRAALLSLAGRVAAGLAIALALVSLLTLLRAGELPHLERLFTFARLFGVAGFGNLPTPLLGFHLVMLATYVAALAAAGVRVARHDSDGLTTAALAWCGVFGLGTGAYFAYRSHPDTLIACFSIWSLTVAVLVVATLRPALARGSLRPSLPLLALLFGFGIAVCSVVQFPSPPAQIERIARTSPNRLLEWEGAVDLVRANVTPGDAVAILTPLGHRVAYASDVTNVVAYTGTPQMPTVEQLDETIDALRAEGGTTVFLGERFPPELPRALRARGYRRLDAAAGFIAFRAG